LKASFLEKKPLRILESYGADFDHTTILGFKEGEYLKTLIVQVI
jgi:23S rRNA G2069 N7-methylase RlmK/C1962 C5-methylase RlmI